VPGKRARALILIAALAVCGAAFAAEFGPYSASVMRVIDGDTLELQIEIWPRTTVRATVRLAGIDTPEARARAECERQAARAATEFARRWVAERKPISVLLTGRDKYGRELGRVVSGGEDLAQALIAAGHARAYDGGKRRGAWCS